MSTAKSTSPPATAPTSRPDAAPVPVGSQGPATNPEPAAGGPFAERLRLLARPELLLPALLVFLLFVPIFSRLVGGVDPRSYLSDYPAHLRQTGELAERGIAPPHPLFHYCVVLLSSGNLNEMMGITAVTLALALGFRAYLTALLLTSRNSPSLIQIIGVCLVLALVMPLPNWWNIPAKVLPFESSAFNASMPNPGWWWLPAVYRGQLAPNVWHNPTGIFAMPFCLLLFILGLRALQSERTGSMVAVGAVMFLAVLAKPNYVMAFAPCFAVAAVINRMQAIRAGRLSIQDTLGQALVAFGPALFVLWRQYRHTYGGDGPDASGVAFAPFVVWSGLTRYIPVSIMLGIAFPLTVVALYWREVRQDSVLVFAWSVMIVAILQFALLIETGERADHGNFGWAAILANQILFIACCDFLLRQPASNARSAAFLVLALHVVSGSLCLARCLFVPSLANSF
jgi:hypothetical protein